MAGSKDVRALIKRAEKVMGVAGVLRRARLFFRWNDGPLFWDIGRRHKVKDEAAVMTAPKFDALAITFITPKHADTAGAIDAGA